MTTTAYYNTTITRGYSNATKSTPATQDQSTSARISTVSGVLITSSSETAPSQASSSSHPDGEATVGSSVNTGTLRNPTTIMANSSNSTSKLLFSNSSSTSRQTLESKTISGIYANNTTVSAGLNSTSVASYGNAATSSLPSVQTTPRAPFGNTTFSVPVNITSTAGLFNTTSVSFLNTTSTAPFLNKTPGPYLNTTSSARFVNTTSAPHLNATSTGRFLNTTSTAATPTPTIDRTCGQSNAPFILRVSQPGGMFDGWYLRISADAILFTASVNDSSLFSVETSGHLCAVGEVGADGNAAVAIVDNTTPGGSAVYLIDGAVALALRPDYGALGCELGADLLACAEGARSHWVGCGIQLDLASDEGEMVVVDMWNCTAVRLSAVYP
ncbi:hypothetical protein NKR23_g1207 [Pleurostoma richardsiae]|uniref:Uncharacterized protein n=1 Tax=Pleurostoma richardsiae TaxID=41990 RepID=A0AA38RTX9_9PEZI|nr:hypothetical protein NKR23_g1207 [Pleurostoma richardsiae]